MGAKQSSPTANPAANGRTRAYSGSDLPSSTSGTSSSSTAWRNPAVGVRYHAPRASGAGSSTSQPHGATVRTLGGFVDLRPQSSINIPNSGGAPSSPESGGSSPEEAAGGERSDGAGPPLLIGSLPAHLSPRLFGGVKCPVCSKYVSSEEMELHLVLCLTKPRVTYNEDVLTKDAGECAICLEELLQGDTIARLPCLCIYHKSCIDEWFEVNRSCPEHPSD
uniref:RING-type E3 ubiquitin transferase n=1 Tax=Oryzias latipes TaxID=8090 RepID=A0A3P9HNI9_ORYLA